MSAQEWTAVAYASAEEDEDAFVVAFEETEDHGHALFLMSDLEEPGDEEIKLGMDTYCLVNEDDVTFYGGVEKAALVDSDDGTVLELDFAEQAATALSLPRGLRLRLDVDRATIDQVRDGLQWVLTFGNPMHRPALSLGAAEPHGPDKSDADPS